MTVPLIVLSVFAVGLGWVGVEEDFPAIGGWIPDWIHHFVGSTIEPIEAVAPVGIATEVVHRFEMIPLVAGIVFGLTGLALGWLIYGWKPPQAGETDRMEAAMHRVRLGWLYEVMRHGFYLDDLYRWTFVKGSVLIAATFAWFDVAIIDGVVNGVGWLGYALSVANRWFDTTVINGSVDLAGNTAIWAGKRLRRVQTGRIQFYLLTAVIAIMVLVGVYLYGTRWLSL